MKRRAAIVALACINVGLLLALLRAPAVRPAGAQPAGVFPTDYIMVTGLQPGTNSEALYLLDLARSRLAALRYDPAEEKLVVFGARDLKADFRPVEAEQ